MKTSESTLWKISLFGTLGCILLIFSQQVLSENKWDQDYECMIEIEKEVLQSSKEDGGFVGIVTILKSDIVRQGTRGEMAMIHVDVNVSIYGSMNNMTSLTTFTNDGNSPLALEKKYLVVLKDVPLYRPRL